MVRRQVKPDPRSRAAAFAKRSEGIRKKARELATLCGVPVALVVRPLAAAAGGGGAAVEWESEEGVLDRYRALPAEARAAHTHRRYLEEELGKEKAKLAIRRQDGALTPWDAALNDMTLDEARELLGTVDAALMATSKRRAELGLPDGGGDGDGDGEKITGICLDDGSEMQLLPGHGKSGKHAPLARDDGFQPRNAGVIQHPDQRRSDHLRAGGNSTGNDDSFPEGWINLSMWTAGDESCNSVAPAGRSSLNAGGDFSDDIPVNYLTLRTGGNFTSIPPGFHARPTAGGGGSSMDADGYGTQSSDTRTPASMKAFSLEPGTSTSRRRHGDGGNHN